MESDGRTFVITIGILALLGLGLAYFGKGCQAEAQSKVLKCIELTKDVAGCNRSFPAIP